MFVLAPFAIGLGPMAPRWLIIDEDQPLGIEINLAVEPGLAPLQEVGTGLLAGMPGLFSA